MTFVATVAGAPVSEVEVDARETRFRASRFANSLPRRGTSEGRQLRRWLLQLLVTERVVDAEAAALGVTAHGAPSEQDLLPDMSARMEIGSVAAAALELPITRALFIRITDTVDISDCDVAEFHARNPSRFSASVLGPDGWHGRAEDVTLDEVRPAITEYLLASARRRAFRVWLDARRSALVELVAGYEHPGDPRQPDNTHRH